MTSISVIIPVYNEEGAIEDTLNRLLSVIKDSKREFEVICVNDGSRDKSAEIISKFKNVKLVSHKVNRGYGASLKDGIKEAKGEHILITDADGTYPIEDIPKLLAEMGEYDMVVGARTGSTVKVPLLRRPVKALLNWCASYIAGTEVPDLNSGLRIFRKDYALRYWHMYPDGFSFTSTITMAFLTNKMSVKYIPINYHQRIGSSTISPIKDTIRFLNLLFMLAVYFRPMKVFFPIASLFMLLALIRGYRDLMVVDSLGNLAMAFFILSVQTFFFGVLAEMIDKRTAVR